MDRARLPIIVLMASLIGVGCAPSPTSAPTPEPSAGGASAFLIRTAQVKPQACMAALITGKLARVAGSGLGLTVVGGPPVVVDWPFRYSARDEGGRIALVDETGTVVAREGEMVQMAGGLGQLDVWFACAPVERLEAIR
jgi:hypothetical protein